MPPIVRKPMTKKKPRLSKLGQSLAKRSLRSRAAVRRGLRSARLRKAEPEAKLHEAIESLPRITNETVAEHREELLRGARKYIYPLEHAKRHIIKISAWLFAAAVLVFFGYVSLALYKFQSTSTFVYYVTLAIPFPVAKAGSSFVSYESYLFELRHYTHYYQTQQDVNFNSVAGRQQLNAFKKQALQQVIDDAYVKQLASKYHVSVTSQDVDNEVQLVRQQNRLGSSQQEFADVLKQFWGWSINDFKRELQIQMLAQEVVSRLDTVTQAHAVGVLILARRPGADFSKLAAQYSDDSLTKIKGGEYGEPITAANQDLPPQVLNELLMLKPGQVSGIINTGYALEVDKVVSNTGGQIRAAHIVFNFQSINNFIRPLEAKNKPHLFIHPR